MKNSNKKNIQKTYARKAINKYFDLLNKRFYPDFDSVYIRHILEISKSFNIRLSREEKLKFCRNCYCYFTVENRKIRLNSKINTIEYICKNCGSVKRFKFK